MILTFIFLLTIIIAYANLNSHSNDSVQILLSCHSSFNLKKIFVLTKVLMSVVVFRKIHNNQIRGNQMKQLVYFALMLALIPMLGCAAVINGTSQSISFTSDPEGATVEIDGEPRGETPVSVKLKKNKHSTVIFKKDGYKSRTIAITKRFDAAAIFSIVLWDLGTTDFATGAAYLYSPDRYYVEMKKQTEE